MTIDQIQTFLQSVVLAHFAQEYRLPLRTLVRIKSGAAIPRAATQAAVIKAIKRSERKKAKQ